MSLVRPDSEQTKCERLGICKEKLAENPKVGLEIKEKWGVWAEMKNN
ncbi:MAG: hypothetical protein Q4F05_04505 [bacterium]|nr:hypothetical protein [bacterium]